MSDPHNPDSTPANPSPEEMHSALFASLVMQQANMAAMLLGQGPQPESGKPIKDLEAARLFIDHLEMLEAKTKGNLNRDETNLLKQSLMNLRLAYVRAVEAEDAPAPSPAAPSPEPQNPAPADSAAREQHSDEEQRKKFSKKY